MTAPVAAPAPVKFTGKLPGIGDVVLVARRSGKRREPATVVDCDAQGTIVAFVMHGLGPVGAETIRPVYPDGVTVTANITAPHRWFPRA